MADLIAALADVLWPITCYAIADMIRKEWQGKHKPAAEAEVVVPDDLMAYAMSHSEQWAQEDALRAIQQSYEQWKDWNRVRAAMGIGRID
jgi:hypothetical protein